MNDIYTIAPDGKYTILYAQGEYRTLQVKTPKNGNLAGTHILSIPNGPKFKGIAFVKTTGVFFWRSFMAASDETRRLRIERAYQIIASDPAKAGRAYSEKSKRCFRCDRELTTPASLAAGIGPECAGKGAWTAADQKAGAEKLRTGQKRNMATQPPLTPAAVLPYANHRAVAVEDSELFLQGVEAARERKQETLAFMSDPDMRQAVAS